MSATAASPHVPVLLAEVLAALAPQPGDVIVDATFGAGGYTRAFLDAGATVHAFDRDPDAIAAGRAWPETRETPPRLVLHPRRFSEMVAALAEAGVSRVDGVAMDIGVSSMQLDQAGRGFAFSTDGPLDMTMSQEGPTAADFLNGAAEEQIADVLFHYGEERQSRRVARAIVAARPLSTTGELAQVVRKALGYRAGAPKDPATRSFQAIRIHVNGELDELEQALRGAEQVLTTGGRLAVVSFHSLEDRIVKRFLREAAGAVARANRYLPEAASGPQPTFAGLSKAIRPSDAETLPQPARALGHFARRGPHRRAREGGSMTPHSRIRRIGWFAALAVCAMLYLTLHLRVHAVTSEVIRAERQIVALEQQKILLETEFQTRSNQLQLEEWNRVDFGYVAPTASQFLGDERQLASFGGPRAAGAPEPIRVAGAGGEAPEYPKLVSPLTGKPIDEALLEPEPVRRADLTGTRLADGRMRIPLGAVIGSASQ